VDETVAYARAATISARQPRRPFAALIREDSFSQLVVISEGRYYVTRGSDAAARAALYSAQSD
jgi:hypothetical protein